MAIPTLPDLFGPGSVVVTNPATFEPTEEGVFIPISALTATGGLNLPSSLSDPGKVLFCLVKGATTWLLADNTEQPNLEALQVQKSLRQRAGTNRLVASYSLEFYFQEPQASYDADELGS